MIWYDVIWYDMIWYNLIGCDMIWYNIILYDRIGYDMIWYDTRWYKMKWCMNFSWQQYDNYIYNCGLVPHDMRWDVMVHDAGNDAGLKFLY